MNQTLTIARRELTSLFFSPIAYVVLALFSLGATLIFLLTFAPGNEAIMRSTFTAVVWLMVLLVPAISMRLLSEEISRGTLEPLMTAPVSDAQVILGKWFGAMGFLIVLLLPLAVFVGVLEYHANPDYGPILTGFLGLLLVGGLYLAIGTFASALSESQLIALVITITIICLFTVVLYFLPQVEWLTPSLREALFYLNVNRQFEDFAKGLIDTSNFAYFLSGIALFLFFSVRVLESRRWR